MTDPNTLDEAIKQVYDAVNKLEEYCTKHDVEAYVDIGGEGMTFVPENGCRKTIDEYWDFGYGEAKDDWPEDWEDDPRYEGYAGWQTSSTLC